MVPHPPLSSISDDGLLMAPQGVLGNYYHHCYIVCPLTGDVDVLTGQIYSNVVPSV